MSGIKGRSGIYRHYSHQLFQKGHPPMGGMLGKHHLEETKKKISETKSGKSWGHHTEESKKKMSELKKGKPNGRLGVILSVQTKQKIGKSNKGKKHTKEAKKKMSEYRISHPTKFFKNTSIELKIEAELQRRNINYQKQVPLCKVAIVDFYLPEYRIVIQCDGDYWHNFPDHKMRDENQDRVLTFNGFNVYRFWEHEINESVENCIDKLKLL